LKLKIYKKNFKIKKNKPTFKNKKHELSKIKILDSK